MNEGCTMWLERKIQTRIMWLERKIQTCIMWLERKIQTCIPHEPKAYDLKAAGSRRRREVFGRNHSYDGEY
ncbi:hypothetical protein PsorP6_003403 [Peronosclerospora sorghi]|uniref:Uncharacterized protein n=1 Tax=Peronosclerospora sorghi TaxID=230839 RepID=A0ACC0VJ93_9STRA|nr:hypothetical protein PsorP6_003403 [Peronosclerospora sorghi]